MNNIYSSADFISAIFDSIQTEKGNDNKKIVSVWKEILLSLSGNTTNGGENVGEFLYAHSKIIDLKNNGLLIETDHPGWIQLFQLHQKYILRGFEKKIPQLKISFLSYTLKGKKNNISGELRDITREELERAITKREPAQENVLSPQVSQESAESKEIPQEVEIIFTKLKNTMLTNGK